MRRGAGGVLLFILGVTVLQMVLFGQFLNYVKPAHRPWLLTTGAGLILLGIPGVVEGLRHDDQSDTTPRRRPPAIRTHGPLRTDRHIIEELERQESIHDHHRVPGIAWLLIIPIFLALLVPPPALGSYAAGRIDATVPRPRTGTRFRPLPAGGPVTLTVHDYAARAVWGHGATLHHRMVALTGFVTPRQDGRWYLTRMLITCCAADALPFKIQTVGTASEYPANTWVKVVGSYLASTTPNPDNAVARIKVATVQPVNQPTEPYEQ